MLKTDDKNKSTFYVQGGKLKKLDVKIISFIVVCVIAIFFIFSPLLIRIPIIHNAVSIFLDAFDSSVYKSTYVETVGAILGTFLAITGALWTQSISNKCEKNIQIEKNALVIYYDFKLATEDILKIMKLIYPLVKSNTLPEDEAIIDKFRKQKNQHRIYLDSNWRQLVTSMREKLTAEEIREAQILYNKLSMISMCFNSSISETSRKEDKNAYSLMYDMINVSFNLKDPTIYEISIDGKISSLVNEISKIANIEQK